MFSLHISVLLNFLCRNSGFSFFLEELLFKNLQGLCIIRSLIFKVQFCKKFSGSPRLKPWFSLLSFRICCLVFCDSLCIFTLELKLVNKNCRFILKKIFIFFKIQDMLSYLPHFVVYFSLADIMIDFFLPKYIMDIHLRKRSTQDGISKRILFGRG